MITRLRIENFLSLRNIDVTLGETTVCVGANMTGKSSLLRALKFLMLVCVSNLNQSVRDLGGYYELAWKGRKPEAISFLLEAEYGEEFGNPKKYYEYHLKFSANPVGDIFIEKERLLVGSDPKDKISLVNLTNGVGEVLHSDGSKAFESPGSTNSILQYDVPGWEGTMFRNILSMWRFYDLNPASMKNINAVRAQPYLSGNGDNLASWLLTLQSDHRKYYSMILEAAKSALPDVTELTASLTQFGTTFLKSREKYLGSDVTVFHMSDGELKYLALLSLVLAPEGQGAPLFGVEEPDTNLHPRLLESLITVFNQFRKELGPRKGQVIITTHSPQLVDLMNLDDLLVFEKRDGCAIITRPSSKGHLRRLLSEKELSLGQLWFSGALGSE